MNEEEKLAYLAGIVEGEGTIAILKQQGTRGRRGPLYSLRLIVSNSSEKLMEWLEDNYGGSVHKVKEKHGRTVYQWVLAPRGAFKLLKKMQPYIIIKSEQVSIAISFQQENTRRHKGRVPIWLRVKRENYFQRMKELHLPIGVGLQQKREKEKQKNE